MRLRGFCSQCIRKRRVLPKLWFGNQFPTFPFIDLSNEEGTAELPFQADWGANKPYDATGSGACRLF